jgi:hypothetical protein
LIARAHHTAEVVLPAGAVRAQDFVQAVENAPQPHHLVVAWSAGFRAIHHAAEYASEVRHLGVLPARGDNRVLTPDVGADDGKEVLLLVQLMGEQPPALKRRASSR